MDDGGGAFISWEALSLIKDLGKYLILKYFKLNQSIFNALHFQDILYVV